MREEQGSAAVEGATDRAPAPGQLEAALSLSDAATARWPQETHHLDPEIYLDAGRHVREEQALFRNLPIAVAPSAMLPESGSFLPLDDHGLPFILSRDSEGRVHAFVNACRHRGSRLAGESEVQCKARIRCPYHFWSYDLSGQLVTVPREEVFSDLDKSSLSLVRLPVAESGGIIWVKFAPGSREELSVNPQLIGELSALGVGQMHLYARRRHEVDANWKLVMDTFLEGYHVIRLHSTTVGQLFADSRSCVHTMGLYLRQTSPRPRDFKRSMVESARDSLSELRRAVVFVYTLFPNAVLIVSPDYVNLLKLMPQGPRRTIVENIMLTEREPSTERETKRWEKSHHLTDELSFPEDFWSAQACQQGLETGVIDKVIIGGMEQPMKVFHDHVERCLAQST
jgi:glycine betaine catabolism A